MSHRAWTVTLLAALVLLVLPTLARAAWFYRGPPSARMVADPNLTEPFVQLETAVPPSQATPAAAQRGLVVVDLAHANNVEPEELNFLVAEILARGHDVEFHRSRNDFLAALPRAGGLIVPVPQSRYREDEVRRIRDFVDRGGRLLMLGDPARTRDPANLNSLAQAFELVAYGDYLYNQARNDGNFRYVFFERFFETPITEGLRHVVLYDAHSVGGAGRPLIRAAPGTYSSGREAVELAVAVMAAEGRAVLVGDATFLMEPFVTRFDNARLARNLARHLTGGELQRDLRDFPWLLGRQATLVYDGPVSLGPAARLASMLQRQGLTVALSRWAEDSELPDGALVLVTTFGRSSELEAWWAEGDLESQLGLGLEDLDREKTALLHLRFDQERPLVSLLGHDAGSLFDLLKAVDEGKLQDLRVDGSLALLVPEKEPKVTPTPTPTPADEATPEPDAEEPEDEPGATPEPEPSPTPTPEPTLTPTPEP